MRFIRTRTVLAVAAASTVLLGLSPAPAHAAVTESTVDLPLTQAADVVAGRTGVFVSSGRTGTSIVAADPTGDDLRTIGDLPGPTDLELSPNGRVLYAALPSANEIAVIDTATLQETARLATGPGACPSSLALSGSTLWFGYGCGQWGGNIGRFDLSAVAPVATVGLTTTYYAYPILSAPRNDPGRLFAAQPSLSPSSVTVYTVTADGALEQAGRTDHTAVGSNLRDVAAAPNGNTFYTASGSPYEILQFETSQLTAARRRFATGPYPNAVEISRDGSQIAAAGAGLHVFRPTSAQTTQLPVTGGQNVIDRGLAWAPNGTQLYAVTAAYGGTTPAVLHIYTASIATRRLV